MSIEDAALMPHHPQNVANRRYATRVSIAVLIVLFVGPFEYRLSATQEKDWMWVDGAGNRHSRAELTEILREHQEWLDSKGTRGKVAELPGANLSGANLENVNLSGANLAGAALNNANMQKTIFGLTRKVPPPNPPTNVAATAHDGTTPTWLQFAEYFVRDLFVSEKSSYSCSTSFELSPVSHLNGASLRGANLNGAQFIGVDLRGTDFSDSTMGGAMLRGVDLSGAVMIRTNLSEASITFSRADGAIFTGSILTSVDFLSTSLNYADLTDAKLAGASFRATTLCGCMFQPSTLPGDARLMASTNGLAVLQFNDRPDALTELRALFREKGFVKQEREITYVLKLHEENGYRERCINGEAVPCTEFFLSSVLFDYTSGYGLLPERPLGMLARLWLICTAFYWVLLKSPGHWGLYLMPSRQYRAQPPRFRSFQKLRPGHAAKRKARLRSLFTKSGISAVTAKMSPKHWSRSIRRWFPLIRAAAWFSTISAFNIGFREINAGRWLRLLTKREYEIKALGWARVVAGIQSLASVYLLALWLLTYFGHPFG